jgi:hypothetical protein
MKITIFKNMKGLIHGGDTKRIECVTDGVLKIGKTEIEVLSDGDSILPLLFYGSTGAYDATFTDIYGRVYDLGMVSVRAGRIKAPSATSVEIMELRCRLDVAEDECEALREEIRNLKNIFDTNSLNFLIK